MLYKKFLLITITILFFGMYCVAQVVPAKERMLWLNYLDKIAKPVLSNLAADHLKEIIPVVLSNKVDDRATRLKASYLEAFGRTLSGIAPWLNLEGGEANEITLRNQYRAWALKAIENAVNPRSKDYMEWNGGQPLVDASFFALGLIRCPWLWQHLDSHVQKQVVNALLLTRNTVPAYSNWLLFSAMIETLFYQNNLPYDPVRIDYAIKEFSEHWYVGDGLFTDGMQYHWDYYNSYVIQPYLATIMSIINSKNNGRYRSFAADLGKINKRYAELQERMINTDGSFPVTGRSITYRGGAFHHLAYMSLMKQLPASLSQGQVRSALTAVLKKTLEAPNTFTKDGWLNIGLYGSQPGLAEFYITTGSLYLCSEILLPLGLPEEDNFWSSPPQSWTSVKVWSGQDLPADHALDIR